jgi:hypothetical protein
MNAAMARSVEGVDEATIRAADEDVFRLVDAEMVKGRTRTPDGTVRG